MERLAQEIAAAEEVQSELMQQLKQNKAVAGGTREDLGRPIWEELLLLMRVMQVGNFYKFYSWVSLQIG